MLRVRFDFRKLQADLGFSTADLPELYERLYHVKVARPTAYAWFERGNMTLPRFIQLLNVVRWTDDRKLDIWKYIEVIKEEPPKTRRAA